MNIPTIWEYQQVPSSKSFRVNELAREGWEVYDHHNDFSSHVVGHSSYSSLGLFSSARGSSPVAGTYSKNVVHMRRDTSVGKGLDAVYSVENHVAKLITQMVNTRWIENPMTLNKVCRWCGETTGFFQNIHLNMSQYESHSDCTETCPVNEGIALYSNLNSMEVLSSGKSVYDVYPNLRTWLDAVTPKVYGECVRIR